jgi:hypothetical protein
MERTAIENSVAMFAAWTATAPGLNHQRMLAQTVQSEIAIARSFEDALVQAGLLIGISKGSALK